MAYHKTAYKTLGVYRPLSCMGKGTVTLSSLSGRVSVGCLCFFLLCHNLGSTVANSTRPRVIERSLGGVGIACPSLGARGRVIYVLSGISRLLFTQGRRLSGLGRLMETQFIRVFKRPMGGAVG